MGVTQMPRKTGPRSYPTVRARDTRTLKELRVKRRLSQEALAELAYVSVGSIQKAEQGKRIVMLMASTIAKALGKPLDALFVADLAEGDPRDRAIDSAGTTDQEKLSNSATILVAQVGKPHSRLEARIARGFVVSVDGIILNSVGELIFSRRSREDHQRMSYILLARSGGFRVCSRVCFSTPLQVAV